MPVVPAEEHLPKHPKHIATRVDAGGEVKVQTTVVLPRQISRALRRIAIVEKRSMSDVMSQCCRYFLDRETPDWEHHTL